MRRLSDALIALRAALENRRRLFGILIAIGAVVTCAVPFLPQATPAPAATICGVVHIVGTKYVCGPAAPAATPTPTPSPTPSPTGTAYYTNFTPFPQGATPWAVATFVSTSHVTVVAAVSCSSNTTGGTLVAVVGSWNLEGGLCDGSTAAANAKNAHFYDALTFAQAIPANNLLAGVSYTVIGTQDGASLNYYQCGVGAGATCVQTTVADASSLGPGTGLFIGGSNATTRVMPGYIWQVAIYNYAASATGAQQIAQNISPNPYITPSPTPSPSPSDVDWPAGSPNPWFPGNPFAPTVSAILASPGYTPNPNSSAYVAKMQTLTGGFALGQLNISTTSSTGYGFPLYYNHSGSNTAVVIHCTADYGGIPCATEGETVYIDTRMVPQSGGCSDQTEATCSLDYHLALIDTAAGYEYDFWSTAWPPTLATSGTYAGQIVLTAKNAGQCSLTGNGFTDPAYSGPSWNAGCNGTASDTPLSMGTVRATDWMAAIADTVHGHLPMTLNYAYACNGNPGGPLPLPFKGSGDGTCAGFPPEGSHLYIAMHDSDVNGLGLPNLTSVLLRTMDEDHYGAIVVDTAGCGCNQIQFNIESGNTYAAWGLPDPWLSSVQPEACSEGLSGACTASGGKYTITLSIPSSIGTNTGATYPVKFL